MMALDVKEGTYQIKIDHSVTSVVHPPRKIPLILREKVKEELDCTEELGVICMVDKPTKWVSSLVFQKKMTQAFEDLTGVKTIADDILIWGKNNEEHNLRLEQVKDQGKLDWSSTEAKWKSRPFKYHTLARYWQKMDWNQILAKCEQWKKCHPQKTSQQV